MVAIRQNCYDGWPIVDAGLPPESLEALLSGPGEYCEYDEYLWYRQIIERAASLLDAGQPDQAALLLDGLPQRMVMAWFARHGGQAPEPMYVLARLEAQALPLAWSLRLALRSPDVGARMVHCRRLLDEIADGIAG